MPLSGELHVTYAHHFYKTKSPVYVCHFCVTQTHLYNGICTLSSETNAFTLHRVYLGLLIAFRAKSLLPVFGGIML